MQEQTCLKTQVSKRKSRLKCLGFGLGFFSPKAKVTVINARSHARVSGGCLGLSLREEN